MATAVCDGLWYIKYLRNVFNNQLCACLVTSPAVHCSCTFQVFNSWTPVFIVNVHAHAPLWWGLVDWCLKRYTHVRMCTQFLSCHGNLIKAARFIYPEQFLWRWAHSAVAIRYSTLSLHMKGRIVAITTLTSWYCPVWLSLVTGWLSLHAGDRMVVPAWWQDGCPWWHMSQLTTMGTSWQL